MKNIAILGSTGSIGTQTLQVIEAHPDRFRAEVLTANNQVELLVQQALKFHPDSVVIANEEKYQSLCRRRSYCSGCYAIECRSGSHGDGRIQRFDSHD